MNVFRNIDRNKYMFDFLVTSDKKEGFYNEIISLGGKVHFIPSRRNSFVEYHKELNRFFRDHHKEYGAVHMNVGSLTSVAPLYYAKIYGIPVRICHSHSSFCTGIHNRVMHYINRARLKSVATHYFACSESSRQWAFRYSGIYTKSQIITNGIDISKFIYNPETRKSTRDNLRLDGKFVVGHVGTFNVIKNQSFLVDVFKELLDVNPNSILMLIGEGATLLEIKNKVERLNLEDRVLFLGRRNDVAQLMQAMDVMAMPSLFEGMPFTLIEAQAAGLPIVASSNIPSDVKLSECYHSVSLDSNTSIWVRTIMRYTDYHKSRLKPTDKTYGYSIEQTILQLTNAYKSSNIKYLN